MMTQRRVDSDPAVGAVGGAFMDALLSHRPAGPNTTLPDAAAPLFADLGSATGRPEDIALLKTVMSNSPLLQQALPHCSTSEEFDAKIPFGRAMRRLFAVAADSDLNFGSFGCTPLPVTAAMALYARFCVDTGSTHAVRAEVLPRLHDVTHVARAFTRTAADDFLALSDNADEAWSAAVVSLVFDPRRWLPPFVPPQTKTAETKAPRRNVVIAYSSTQFIMVSQVVGFWLDRTPSDSPVTFEQRVIDFTPERLAELDASAVEDTPRRARGEAFAQFYAAAAAGADIVVLDHISSTPAFKWPVRRVAELLRAANPDVLLIVDGAHAAGQLPINLSDADAACWDIATTAELEADEDARAVSGAETAGRPVDFDIYFSNFHKWLAAPKSSAFLWAKGRHASFLHPPLISIFYRQDLDMPEVQRLAVRQAPSRGGEGVPPTLSTELRRTLEFMWRGTRDHSAWFALPDTLLFRKMIGGERRIQRYNRELARRGGQLLAERLGTDVHLSSPALCPSMVGVRLPHRSDSGGVAAAKAVVEAARVRGVMIGDYVHGGVVYVRVSAQVYLGIEDFEIAAGVLLEELRAHDCVAPLI